MIAINSPIKSKNPRTVSAASSVIYYIEIECPRCCYDIMVLSSDFDRLYYFCEECSLSLLINQSTYPRFLYILETSNKMGRFYTKLDIVIAAVVLISAPAVTPSFQRVQTFQGGVICWQNCGTYSYIRR